MNTICTHIDYAYRGQVEPSYLERLIEDIKYLQAAIPAQELAIQIDAAVEFAYLEYEMLYSRMLSSSHIRTQSRRKHS